MSFFSFFFAGDLFCRSLRRSLAALPPPHAIASACGRFPKVFRLVGLRFSQILSPGLDTDLHFHVYGFRFPLFLVMLLISFRTGVSLLAGLRFSQRRIRFLFG
jgi:hypothetical protein